MTLDGVKTGKAILPEVFKEDKKRFDKEPPRWKGETEEETERRRQRNQPRVARPPKMEKFVMDYLYDQAGKEGNEWLARIDRLFYDVPRSGLDEDLAAPYKKAVELAERWETEEKTNRMKRELEMLESHVKKVYDKHRAQLSLSPRKGKGSPSKGGSSFSDLPIEIRQDKIRKVSKQFASFPAPNQFLMADEEVARIRASYAYFYDFEKKKYCGIQNYTRFPWDVAMRELCGIKARTARYKPVSAEFYDQFKMKDPSRK